MEEEHQEEREGEMEGGMEGEGEENFGFHPFEEEDEREKKKEQDNSPEAVKLRQQINKLVCRFASLRLRSSSETLAALSNYNAVELQGIYDNCINDLQEIRGTPSSEMVTNVFCSGVEKYTRLEGYRIMCLEDKELQRDIEAEMIDLLYWGGNRIQMLFRFANNAYKCYYDMEAAPNKKEEDSESVKAVQRGIKDIFDEQDEREKERKNGENNEISTKSKKRANDGEKKGGVKKRAKGLPTDSTSM